MCVSLVTGPRVLTVLGRDLTLEKTCGSIADCTFDELCGRVSVSILVSSFILRFSSSQHILLENCINYDRKLSCNVFIIWGGIVPLFDSFECGITKISQVVSVTPPISFLF